MTTRRRGKKHGPSGLSAKDAEEDVKAILKQAKESLTSESVTESFDLETPLHITTRTHINSDGSVDGELRIMKIPDEIEMRQLLTELEQGHIIPTLNLWVSVGVRHGDLEGEKSGDSRYRGLIQLNTYFGRFDQRRLTYEIETAKLITDNLAEQGRPKPEQVYIRIHWNKKNQKPAKRYGRRERDRK